MRFLSLPAIAYLLVLFYIPFLIVMLYSLGYPKSLTLEYYIKTLTSPIFLKVFINSLIIAVLTTVICLVLAYPVAYYIASKSERKNLLLVLVILPFWINFLLRTYALMTILAPLGIMFSFTAVIVGMVYDYLPFMILPLYASLEKISRSQIEASYTFGATPLQTFLRITLPLSKPGIVAGIILVFVPSLGEFVVPAMLGGTVATIGTLTWDLFLRYHDWWRGSAISVIYMTLVFFSMLFYVKKAGRLKL